MGRFGWKASEASLKHQVARRLNDGLGITTTIYPKSDRGSEQTDLDTAGNRMPDADIENIYRYYALRAVPPRRDFRDETVLKGEKLFASASCANCHAPTLKTSPYHPMTELRNQTIHPYTDLLLHNMGPELADNMAHGTASAQEWRTAAAVGHRPDPRASCGGEAYLHDGRARDLSEAILWHGGEGKRPRKRSANMPAADRAALIKFLKSL